MKKIQNVFIIYVLAFVLTGCGSGISEEQYNTVCAERDALQMELQNARTQAEEKEKENGTLSARISGSFTAKVRALIPDYVLDTWTPQVAVVTLFQDGPFTMCVGSDMAEQLEVGKIYVFEIEPKENVEITREEYEYGLPFPDEAIYKYKLSISGFTAVEEDDYGLETGDLVFTLD